MSILPTDLSGLGLWVKADQISGNDGDAIATWSDQSGIGRHLTQATGANQPLLKKAANGINSQNVVRFDGSNDSLSWTTGGSSILNNVASAHFFIVKKLANTSQDAKAIFLISRNAPGSPRAAFYSGLGDGKFNMGGRRLDANSFQALAGANLDTNAHIKTGLFDWANSTATLREDGTQTATTASFQTAGNTSATNSVEITAGGTTIVDTNCAVDIAEIIIYVPKLGATDMARIEWYLAEKYAIAGPVNPDVETPAISPNGGTFTVPTEVTLTCGTAGADIYYTTDGSTPDDTDTLYTVPFTLSADATVKAIGIKSGLTDSAVASAVFDIEIPAAVGGSRIFSGSGGNDFTKNDGFFRNQN